MSCITAKVTSLSFNVKIYESRIITKVISCGMRVKRENDIPLNIDISTTDPEQNLIGATVTVTVRDFTTGTPTTVKTLTTTDGSLAKLSESANRTTCYGVVKVADLAGLPAATDVSLHYKVGYVLANTLSAGVAADGYIISEAVKP